MDDLSLPEVRRLVDAAEKNGGVPLKMETKAVHAGRGVDPATGAVTPPIHLSTTFEGDADGGYRRGVASEQMSLYGGMLSFLVQGDRECAMDVAANVRVFTRATSLGGTHSYVEHRASIEGPGTAAPENLLRLSVGLEHPDDLTEDLARALGPAKL
jgi:cystathionine beta-lyase/cystathionine gamma-synthase